MAIRERREVRLLFGNAKQIARSRNKAISTEWYFAHKARIRNWNYTHQAL